MKQSNATITADQALALLKQEVNSTKNSKIECVKSAIQFVAPYVNKKNVTVVTQNNLNARQYAALISMVYEVGCSQFGKASSSINKVLKNLTANINDSIPSIIGKIGNATHRQAEIAFFQTV